MLVTLEALKTSVSYLNFDIDRVNDKISVNAGRIGANQDDIYDDQAANLGVTNNAASAIS